MNCSKNYYGKTFLNKEDLLETEINNRIELEYYTIKEENYKRRESYGIEVLKKEYINNDISIESNIIQGISRNFGKVIEIIEKLKNFKVTPIGLEDVVIDLLQEVSE